jgi:uncharacterized RDD family membrane protein YckC
MPRPHAVQNLRDKIGFMRYLNRIILQTPESVELEFTLAGIGNRALALALDYLLMLLFLLMFLGLWFLSSEQLFNYLDALNVNYSALGNWLIAIAILIGFFVWVGYFAFFETLWQGQTPGKRIAKIRVIRDDGRPARLPQAILRALLRPVDDTLSIGVGMIILSQQEKRLGDWVAGTVVIQEAQPIVALNRLSNQAQPLADELLQFIDLSRLLPDDFATIREYLQRRSLMTSQARSSFSSQLAEQVKNITGLEKLPRNATADLFLEAVYLAYQQQFPY